MSDRAVYSKEVPTPSPHLVALAGAAALCLAWGYGSAVFLVGESWLPISFGAVLWYVSIIVVGVAAFAVLSSAVRRYPSLIPRIPPLVIGTLSLVGSIVVADIAFASYLNATAPFSPSNDARFLDKHVWIGELYPAFYYPTRQNFRLHKPGVFVSGTHFGGRYHSSMLASPTLVDRVLESRTITIDINDRGFRESSSMAEASIFALGDSFTFGWGVDAASAWPRILESITGQTIYNLGIHDSSPKQELELLDFVLRTYPDSHGIRQLLWMIYEGNDLEDSYAETAPEDPGSERRRLLRGTLLALVANVPGTIRGQSIMFKLRTGEVTLRRPRGTGTGTDPYEIDNVQLQPPLYHSDLLGWRLFAPQYVEYVQADASYVDEHPNRQHLEVVFERMAALAEAYNFDVIVILAPTAARLHGPYYDGFPNPSARPYFLDLVSQLADAAGFEVVNLYRDLAPFAASELLYFRDDDHFNERGHEIVAEIIEREIFKR